MENFVACISNEGYPASLESRKIYKVIPDAQAESRHYLRVMDESGEDYLYPEKLSFPLFFVFQGVNSFMLSAFLSVD